MKTPATPEEWEKLQQLFEQVVDQSPEQRSALLEKICGSDDELKSQLQELLAFHQDDEGLLDRPLLPPALQVGEMIDRRIGPYRIKALLGEGGMGEVYLAERDDGEFRKRVAVKVLRVGPGYRLLSKRFESERQILAQLEHQNIARLLDGGKTEEGLPYFILEYVEGLPVGEYCDTNRLGIPERLVLFCKICDAVQYAHRNLVIHRDIKPGNVLVGMDGEPKLLDFGIAKFLSSDPLLTPVDSTLTLLRAMTPQYASPEQVRGEVVTTASDVYALGVLLYELLTGHKPYNAPALTPEVVRAICEEEPSKPSVAVMGEGEAHELNGQSISLTPRIVALQRSSTPSKLRRSLLGDLDNVVLKAMRKEPERRYDSAGQLAEDLQRHLGGFPVSAQPDTFRYRVDKFIRRNQVAVAAAIFAVLALVGGTGISVWQARNAMEGQSVALVAQSRLLLANNQPLDALTTALRAERALDTGLFSAPVLKEEADSVLRMMLQSVHEYQRFEGYKGSITSLDYSPDGHFLASASFDKVVRLWDLKSGRLALALPHSESVWSTNFSPSGRLLATGDFDGRVRLWAPSGALVSDFQAHNGLVLKVAFSNDEHLMVTAGKDQMVRLWKLKPQIEQVESFKQPGLDGMAFNSGRGLIATTDLDSHIRLWDISRKPRLLRIFPLGHLGAVFHVAISSNGRLIATCGEDRTIRLWNLQGRQLRVFSTPNGIQRAATFDPSSQFLAAAGDDRTIRVWDLNGNLVESLPGHSESIYSLRFSSDGHSLASGGVDRTVRLWRLQNPLRSFKGRHEGSVILLERLGNIVVSAGEDGTLQQRNALGDVAHSLLAHNGSVRAIDMRAGHLPLIASGGNDQSVMLWPLGSGAPLRLRGHKDFVLSVQFDPYKERLASGSRDGKVLLWNLRGQRLAELRGHTAGVIAIRFGSDGVIATASRDGTVRLWAGQGSQTKILRGHRDEIAYLELSPDRKILASAGDDGTVRLWNWQGKLLRILFAQNEEITALRFAPDGQWIASGAKDGTIRLWNLKDRSEATLTGHTDKITSLAFDPSSMHLASASQDGTVQIWNTGNTLLVSIESPAEPILRVLFSQDGKTLFGGGRGGDLFAWHKWEWKRQETLDNACLWLLDYLRPRNKLRTEVGCEGVNRKVW